MTKQDIRCVTLLVRDYDEAKTWYCNALGFKLVEDTLLPDGKRWILVTPQGSSGTSLLLAKATGAEQADRVGAQTADRVFLFLHTDDFWQDFHAMRQNGVRFREEPREESYGIVAVFEDIYGNRWDLLQPNR